MTDLEILGYSDPGIKENPKNGIIDVVKWKDYIKPYISTAWEWTKKNKQVVLALISIVVVFYLGRGWLKKGG